MNATFQVSVAVALACFAGLCAADEEMPVGHWSGDETQELTVLDASGHGGHGISTGPLDVVQGVVGKAMAFMGRDDRVEVGHGAAIDLGAEGQDYSISFWFRSSVLPQDIPDAHFITKMGTTYPFSFVQLAGGLVQMRTYDGTSCPSIDSGLDLSDGGWHFVVGTRDGERRRLCLYVDGLLVSSGDDSTQGDLRNTGPLYLGRSHGADFNGALDEVKLYDRLLTREEIRSEYARTAAPVRRRTVAQKRLTPKRAPGVPAMRRRMENWTPKLTSAGDVQNTRKGDLVRLANAWMAAEVSTVTGEVVSLVSKGKPLLSSPGGVTITDVLTGETFTESDGKVVEFKPQSESGSAGIRLRKRYGDHYEAIISYTMGGQALCCDVKLSTSLMEPRESRIEFSMPALRPMKKAFWVDSDAPASLDELPTEQIVYRNFNMMNAAMVIPSLTVYDEKQDIGLGFVAPFDLPKPGLCFRLDTLEDCLNISNFYLRLAKDEPARAALYIVPHEGCWRPSLAWMLRTWPDYFRPGTTGAIESPGWYHLGGPHETAPELKAIHDAGAKWFQIHGHFPFYGLYMPETKDWNVLAGLIDEGKADLETWERGEPQGGPRNGYDQMREAIRLRQDNGLQAFLYFQSFELWDQYAAKHYLDDVARSRGGAGHTAWPGCSLMNPDPASAWGQHIAAQIEKVPQEYPALDGIFYDRDDYRDYDYAHDDGVTMNVDTPAYMLGFAQQQMNDIVTGVLRKHRMGVFANVPTSVEVTKHIDGIMCETNRVAACLQYLGLTRPMVLLPYFFESSSYDTTPRETEEKIKTALSMGYYPSLTFGDDACKKIDARYKSLFDLMKDRQWVLSPRPLSLQEGIAGNIFRTPSGEYLVTVVDFSKSVVSGDAPTRDVTVEINVPDAESIRHCRVLSGDGVEPQTLRFARKGTVIQTTIPEHLMCSVVVFSTKQVMRKGQEDK